MFKNLTIMLAALVLLAIPFAVLGDAARTTINETDFAKDSYVNLSSATGLDNTSGMQINASKDNRLVLVVYNNASDALNVTVEKGAYFRSGLGNLSFQVPAESYRGIGPLESSRFEGRNGYINLTFNSTDGTILGYRLPSS